MSFGFVGRVERMSFASGWKQESESESESHWGFSAATRLALGPIDDTRSYDLRSFSSPRHDQRHTESCVGQAVAKALEIKRIKSLGREAHVDLSASAIYYLARELTVPPETMLDEGTYVSKAMESVRRFGVCLEADWPFREETIRVPPTWRAMRNVYTHSIKAWYRIHDSGPDRVVAAIQALATGNPIVYGQRVGKQWLEYKAGEIITKPSGAVIGGHATVLVGWLHDVSGGVFVGENSWSEQWGDHGFYLISPDVIASPFAADFTVIEAGWE